MITARKRQLLLPLTLMILLMTLLALVLLASATLSLSPAVDHPGALTAADVREIEQLIADNSPARFRSSGERELSLTARELTLLSNFALANLPRFHDVATTFEITGSSAQAWLSIPQDIGLTTVYLNLRAGFEQQDGRARLISLHAGRVPVPHWVIRAAERVAGQRLATASTASRELAELRHTVDATALHDSMLHLKLQWEPEALTLIGNRARQVLVSHDDRERVLAYYTKIRQLAGPLRADRRSVSLQALLPDLFSLALQRTEADPDADAIAENRALLQALSVFVNDLRISELISELPTDYSAERPADLRVTLFRREDLGQHFVTSAAITASTGADIALVLANTKEVYDARHRSGFSFSDMTANAAGVALGESATRNGQSARQLQTRLAAATAETDYMPAPRTDADDLNEQQFAESFVDRNSESYNARLAEIDAMVMRLPIYQRPIYQQ
tara:strand:- start:42586 stop:43935 length:1350 start_codon:yes stop_codon:yes gene_type:complete